MNTLRIESKLAEKYKYKKLPDDLSQKYRQFFKDNIPDFLNVCGCNSPLYTCNGTKLCDSYDRIVIGDYGAFVEFSAPSVETEFIIQHGQEYRINDERYSKNVKYLWLTVGDSSQVKIYKQIKTVIYADYRPDKYYVSVHECFSNAS